MTLVQQAIQLFEDITAPKDGEIIEILPGDALRIQIDGENVSALKVEVLGSLKKDGGFYPLKPLKDSTLELIDITALGIYTFDVSGYSAIKVNVTTLSGKISGFIKIIAM